MWTRQAQPGKKEGAPRTAWKPQPGACREWLQGQHTPLLCAGDVSSAGLEMDRGSWKSKQMFKKTHKHKGIQVPKKPHALLRGAPGL